MRRLCFSIGVASLTFVVGLSTKVLIDYTVTDELVESIETCNDYASATMLWREPKLIPPRVSSCGHFVITITDDRQLYLNSHWMGKLDEPLLLIKEIEKVFDVRTQSHVYRRGMEEAYEVPYPDRIDKTVYLKAGRALSYGDVHDLVESLKAIGANPIGLLPDPQYPFTEQ